MSEKLTTFYNRLLYPIPGPGVLLALTLSVSGCSTKLTYNFLDWWMGWKVRGYVTLDREQRIKTGADIDAFHAWHRQTQLPVYAKTLEQLRETLAQAALNARHLDPYAEKASEFWDASIVRLIGPATALAATLSDEQVVEILENLEQERQEFYREHVEPAAGELQERRAERMTDMIHSWVGRLDASQRQLIETWSREIKPWGPSSFKQRRLWQQRLKTVLSRRGQTDTLAAEIEKLLDLPIDDEPDGNNATAGPSGDWQRAYRDLAAFNRELTLRLMAALNNSLSAKQRRKRDHTIARYIEDFRELATAK